MKNWMKRFLLALVLLLFSSYFIIGINKLVLGCHPTRQFIYLILIISSLISVLKIK